MFLMQIDTFCPSFVKATGHSPEENNRSPLFPGALDGGVGAQRFQADFWLKVGSGQSGVPSPTVSLPFGSAFLKLLSSRDIIGS